MRIRAEVTVKASDALSPALAGVLRESVETAGSAAVDAAKRLAPVKTGRLRDSIGYTVSVSPDGAAEAVIGSDVPYAAAQELGTARIAGKHFLEHGLAEGASAVFGAGTSGKSEVSRKK